MIVLKKIQRTQADRSKPYSKRKNKTKLSSGQRLTKGNRCRKQTKQITKKN